VRRGENMRFCVERERVGKNLRVLKKNMLDVEKVLERMRMLERGRKYERECVLIVNESDLKAVSGSTFEGEGESLS